MLLVLSMDGAQLYQNKESDTWFGIATIIDYAPEIHYAKEMVLLLFVIGGPNAPKNYDLFLFPTFAHLSACQRLGLWIWDASTSSSFDICPWFGFGTADMVGMAELNGWVSHHGRNRCQVLCSMPGRHKPGAGTYYPAMLKPHGDPSVLPPGSAHPDVSINSITIPSPAEYNKRLCHILGSMSTYEYGNNLKETGICKPSIVSGLPKSIPVPKCFPADTMHLFALNISQLLVSLWCGSIYHAQDDDPTTWPFGVLHDDTVWQAHGHLLRVLASISLFVWNLGCHTIPPRKFLVDTRQWSTWFTSLVSVPLFSIMSFPQDSTITSASLSLVRM